MHSLSSNTYGTMDNDDVFQYLGGLSLAVQKESGRTPDTLITLQRIPRKVGVENITRTLGRELRTRYLNPKWVKGMKKEGYAGAREMYNFVEYLWGWQVTVPSAVDGAKWEQIYEVYVEDKYELGLKKFLKEENPWAYQAMTAWMLESVRKGYWSADEAVKGKLAAEYATSVVEKGTSCCCHACNNPFLNQMVGLIIGRAGAMAAPRRAEMVEKFKQKVKQATWKTFGAQIEERKVVQKKLRDGFGLNSSVGRESGPDAQRKRSDRLSAEAEDVRMVDGYKMEVVEPGSNTPQSSLVETRWFLYVIPAALLLLFVLGMVRRR